MISKESLDSLRNSELEFKCPTCRAPITTEIKVHALNQIISKIKSADLTKKTTANPTDTSIIEKAIKKNDMEFLGRLINNYKDILLNWRAPNGEPITHYCAKHGTPEILALLIKFGKVNLQETIELEDKHRTPIELAALNNKWNNVEMIAKCHTSSPGDPENYANVLLMAAQNRNADTRNVTSLSMTAQNRNADRQTRSAIIQLVKASAPAYAWNEKSGYHAIHYLVANNNIELIKHISQAPKFDINAQIQAKQNIVEFSFTPLMLAAQYARITSNTLDFLLECRANINEKTSNGRTALFLVVENNQINKIKLLVEHGADLLTKVDRHYLKRNPLEQAVLMDNFKIIKTIYAALQLQNGIFNEDTTLLFYQALELGIVQKKWWAVNSLLDLPIFTRKSFLCVPSIIDWSKILETLIKNNRILSLEKLFKIHPELINFRSKKSNHTPLMFAASCSNVTVKTLNTILNQEDLNINETLQDGTTALHLAITSGNVDKVRILIEKGASLTIEAGESSSTPIRLAAYVADNTKNWVIVATIAELKSASENDPEHYGHALLWAARRQKWQVCESLISVDTDPNIAFKYHKSAGKSTIYYFLEHNQSHLIKLLFRTQEFNVNFQANKKCLTPLMHAAKHSHIEHKTLKLLLSHEQIDVNKKANDKTALDFAITKLQLKKVKFIIKSGKISRENCQQALLRLIKKYGDQPVKSITAELIAVFSTNIAVFFGDLLSKSYEDLEKPFLTKKVKPIFTGFYSSLKKTKIHNISPELILASINNRLNILNEYISKLNATCWLTKDKNSRTFLRKKLHNFFAKFKINLFDQSKIPTNEYKDLIPMRNITLRDLINSAKLLEIPLNQAQDTANPIPSDNIVIPEQMQPTAHSPAPISPGTKHQCDNHSHSNTQQPNYSSQLKFYPPPLKTHFDAQRAFLRCNAQQLKNLAGNKIIQKYLEYELKNIGHLFELKGKISLGKTQIKFEGWNNPRALKALTDYIESSKALLKNHECLNYFTPYSILIDKTPDSEDGQFNIAVGPEQIEQLKHLFEKGIPISIPSGFDEHSIWLTFWRHKNDNYVILTNFGRRLFNLSEGSHFFEMQIKIEDTKKFFSQIINYEPNDLELLCAKLSNLGIDRDSEPIYTIENKSQQGDHCTWISAVRSLYVTLFIHYFISFDISSSTLFKYCFNNSLLEYIEQFAKNFLDGWLDEIKQQKISWLTENSAKLKDLGVTGIDTLIALCKSAMGEKPNSDNSIYNNF